MTGRLGRAALLLGLALSGCAQGYDDMLEDGPPFAGGFASGTGSIGAGRGGAGRSGTGSLLVGGTGGSSAMYTGDPCERDETEECTCEGGLGEGIRTCRKDDLSPTMGTFSACEACVLDSDPAGMGGGGSGRSGSGSAGRGGTGGSGGGSSGSGSSAGRSGSGSAGRSGGSGSGGGNDPAWCFFVPIPLPGVCD
jgi:hypothetical protein